MLWFLAIVIGLVLLIIIALQFPGVQNFAAQKGASYLSNTLDTKVEIGGFTTDWRNALVLEDVYVEDQQQDTLWYSQRLGVDLKIFSLLKGEVNVSKVHLQQATLNLHIRPDSSTNFDFIAEAFATDTAAAQPADTTAGAMKINLDVIDLEKVYVNFRDEAGGNLIKARVGRLLTTMEELDLDAERYLIDKVELRNTGVKYVQTKLPPEEESEPITFQLGLNEVDVENFELSYISIPADQRIELDLGKTELIANDIDLPNAKVDLQRFDLHNSSVLYVQEKLKPSDSLAVNPAETVRKLDESVEKTQGQPVKWVITLNDLNVSGLQAAMNNADAPKQARGMDFNHLKFSDVEIDANDIRYSLNRMGMTLNQMKLEEQSGFEVNNFQADITLDSTHARLANLDLQTGNSHIQKDLAMRYSSWEDLTENVEGIRLDLDIDNSRIGMRDVLYFAPELADNPSFRKITSSTLRLDGRVQGRVDNLTIQRLQLAGLQGTKVDVSGNVRNATDPDNLYLDLDINQLASTRTDIVALSPPGTLPPEIRIPATVSMTGRYSGTLTNFDAQADVRSSLGNLNAVLDMDAGPAGAEPFKAKVRTTGFELGQLFTEDYGVGRIALEATANGTGLTPETMRANVKARVREANYNGYAYNNVDVEAAIDRNLYKVAASARDENLNLDLTGDFNLRENEQARYVFNADIENVDLKALNFYEEELALQGQLQGNFTGADISDLSGTLQGQQLVVRHQQVSYPIDSLQLLLDQQGPGAEVQLTSNILNADMRFANNLETLPTALGKHFSNYFDLQPDPPYPANVNLGDFAFELQVRRPDIIASFVPGLERIEVNGPITGSFNGQTQEFAMDANVGQLTYTEYNLRDVVLQVRGDKEQLGYDLGIAEMRSPTLLINNISLGGAARDNDLTVRLAITENSGQEQFVIGGLLNSLGKGYRFSFNPDQLVINREPWSVPEDNYLQFDTNLLYANNIRLERNGSYLALNSTGPVAPDAPLQVEFNNFEIAYIMESFQQQDSLVSGVINGTATLNNLMAGTLNFTSDLTVSDFAYTGIPVGDIALKANSSGANRYNIDASLTGNGNQVLIGGFYEVQPDAGLLNLDANIANLNIASLGGFTQGMVDDLDGSASGKLRITGTVDDPNIRGSLDFNQAQFNLTMLNSVFTLQNERLDFNEQGISMNNFTITDSLGNDLNINGNILTQTYTDFSFDMKVDTDRFLAMNSTAVDNDLFYGTVLVAADATITGNMAEPTIDVRARVLDNSDFTTVIPADEVAAAEREGVVEFVNLNDSLTAIVGSLEKEETAPTGFVGANIDAQISVTDATTITIVIDPTTGDNLVVRGTADPLYIGITPSGQISMSGRYEITDGKYSMDFYDLVSRELDIAKGSYIAWTGDPMLADIQVTAIYNVKTAPMELVASQTGSMEQGDNRFRNQLPFEVYVNVTGEMLTPEIDFDIQIPEEERGSLGGEVEARLATLRQDESEMNKQVFALLVLGRFLAPDPLASSGGGLGATARNSLSQVMSDQLNQLTNRYAGGLGLELGVSSYEDYSSGSAEGRTDLNVALRQQFLNDRLTVRVGTDIGLEGQGEAQSNMSGFGGDVSVEYSLTSDGRLRVRGFQRNQYEGFLEGDVRATGLGLIFVRDYDNFSDLFRSLESREARKEERRMEEALKLSEEEKRKQAEEAKEEVQENIEQ